MSGKNCSCAFRILCFFWLGCLWGFASVCAQTPLARTPGSAITQELANGEQRIYQVTLTADEYLNFIIGYKGVVLSIALNDPNGKPLAEWAGGVDTIGNFEAAIVAPVTGLYQLVLTGRVAAPNPGTFHLELRALRTATEQDRRYAAAHQLMLEAMAFYNLRTADSRRKALAKYEEAMRLWQLIQETKKELEAMEEISFLYRLLGEPRRGLGVAQEMLAKARQHKIRAKEMIAMRMVGSAHLALDEYQSAAQYFEQALSLSRELQDRQMEQALLNSLGVTFANSGQGQVAIGYYQKALQLARENGDEGSEAGVLNNLGMRWSVLGEPEKAVAHFEQALALYRRHNNQDGQARALSRLSEIQLQQGEFQSALDYVSQSHAYAQKAGNRFHEATALLQIGHIHRTLGDSATALTYLAEAKGLYQATENRANEAETLSEMGLVYLENEDFSKAEDFFQQALKIERTINFKERIITELMNLGVVYLKQGNPQHGLGSLTESLTLSREMNSAQDEASCLLYISRAHRALGDTTKALSTLQSALPLAQKLGRRLLEAEIQHDIASLALRQQQYETAQAALEAALQIIETSRIGLAHPEARAVYRSRTQSFYEAYTDVLVQRARQQNNEQFVVQALESVERGRARSFMDLLVERRIDFREGVDAALLKRERELQTRAAARIALMQSQGKSEAARLQVKTLEDELTKIYAELQEIEAAIRRTSPAYAALTRPQPLKLSSIQQQLLDRNTLLLEYALGANQSYLFAITPTSLKVFALPSRTEIETTVRQYYDLVEKQNNLPLFSDLTKRRKFVQGLGQEQQAIAARLSQILLQPVATELKQKRLLIVPDGALYYAPFAALPSPEIGGQRERAMGGQKLAPSPLIVQHEILTLPSASTLALTRQQLADRPRASQALAMFADPVFSASDDRVATQTRGTTDTSPASRLPRLLYTRQEAQAILQLVPDTQRFAAFDFAANRTQAMNPQLHSYRYLHFATHGTWNDATPELSGLLLSQLDEAGKPQNGLLTTRDVFNLKLAAELVVLSGCQTAQGKPLHGEGMVGLMRGFMYAGAHRVVASLWQVNDVATAKLMEKFYQGMLGEKRLSPSAALRAAQIALWQDKRWNAPHYWAAFILQGEW